MRILVLTNLYPPYELGGQGQSCQQVVEDLQQRGHSTLVLTSMHGTDNVPITEDGIARLLFLEMDMVPWRHSINFFTQRRAREKHNLACFERVANQFQPDVIFMWGMWNLPRSLPALVEARFPGRVAYRFAEYWPTLPSQHELYWRKLGRRWYSRLPKWLVGKIALAILAKEHKQYALKFEHAMCVSAATRNVLVEAGVPVSNACVIHTGLDATLYLNGHDVSDANGDHQTVQLLYAGRLSADKGIDTAIKAMEKLVSKHGLLNVRLSLAGSGSEAYQKHLDHLVDTAKLNNDVTFLGRIPSEEMPALLRKFDILLVPSIWPEPFARMVLEGMSSGLAVIATPCGGTPEIIVDGENGMLFAPGDADDLAQKIARLIADPELCQKLARAGQETILKDFTKTKMMDKIETFLQEVANHPSLSTNKSEWVAGKETWS